MKILMTTDAVGGVWQYSTDLAKQLVAKDIEVVLVCMGPCPDQAQLSAIKNVQQLAYYHHPYDLEWMDDPWEDVFDAGDWLLKIQQTEKADLIHLNGYTHASLGWNCPVVVVAHSCVYTWHDAVKNSLPSSQWDEYYHEVHRGLHAADVVVAPSLAMMQAYEKTYGDFKNKKVIYNGIDLKEMNSGEVKEPFIFSMGRLWDDAKNITKLIEAAPEIECDIIIAGPKPRSIGKLPDNVFLLGSLSREEVVKWLSKAAIYALPAKYEPFGLSYLEAAASGCALVGGKIDTLQEIWGDAMTYTDVDDAEQIAITCNQLMLDPDRQRLGLLAKERAGKYTLESQVNEYIALYSSVLSEVLPVGK